jgi:hypothetical protein
MLRCKRLKVKALVRPLCRIRIRLRTNLAAIRYHEKEIAMHIEPVPTPGDPGIPPIPPFVDPPVKEPEPDRLPDEEPLPNPDENDNPPKWN